MYDSRRMSARGRRRLAQGFARQEPQLSHGSMDGIETSTQIQFNAPGIGAQLSAMTDDELDSLPFGVVEMNRQFQVLRYNSTESRQSGLPPARVLGRHFFRDVAPCANNRHVAERFEQAALDETVAYTFLLNMRPAPVTLRMLKSPDSERMHLLVSWT
jgi:photoactive yellow protein